MPARTLFSFPATDAERAMVAARQRSRTTASGARSRSARAPERWGPLQFEQVFVRNPPLIYKEPGDRDQQCPLDVDLLRHILAQVTPQLLEPVGRVIEHAIRSSGRRAYVSKKAANGEWSTEMKLHAGAAEERRRKQARYERLKRKADQLLRKDEIPELVKLLQSEEFKLLRAEMMIPVADGRSLSSFAEGSECDLALRRLGLSDATRKRFLALGACWRPAEK